MNPRGRLRLRRRQYWPSQSTHVPDVYPECTWYVPYVYLICTLCVPDMYPTCTWYVLVLCNLDHVINAISLFWTSFFSFLRLEFHFLDPKSARKKNSVVRMDERMHRIWPDLEAPGTTPRTPKKLPVTARSSQKETHKCSSNSLKEQNRN